MKQFFKVFGVLLLVIMTTAAPVYALSKSDDRVIVRSDEVIDDDFYVAGNEVTIEGTINGDLYAFASNVNVRGTVNGDVIAIGENINITGIVRDDVRAAGQVINFTGADIGDGISIAGKDLTIDQGTTIAGGLLFGGQNLVIDGSVGRGITGGGLDARIDGPVAKSVRISADNITIDQDAVIQGDFEYSSDSEATINGQVLGSITKRDDGMGASTDGIMRWFIVGYNAWAFIGAAIIGGILILLFPRIFKRADERFRKKPWSTVGIGAVITLATLPATLLLMFTVFGVPLALLSMAMWMISIYFTKFFVAYSVGSMLMKRLNKDVGPSKKAAYAALLVGLIIFYVLRLLPGIGFLVRFLTVVVGFGIMITLYNRPSKQPK